MAEYIPNPDYQQPGALRHRVTLLLGTLGLAELSPRAMDDLVMEARFIGVVGEDELRVCPDSQTDNYFIDWIVSGSSSESVVTNALARTLQVMQSTGINPDAVAIKGAYVTDDEGLFDRFPDIARADMSDFTDIAQDASRGPY